MFTWLPEGVVQGPGFTVGTEFNFAVYREGDSKITISVKRAFRGNRHLIVIPTEAFLRWDNKNESNSPNDQARMRENFVAAMEFAGCLVE